MEVKLAEEEEVVAATAAEVVPLAGLPKARCCCCCCCLWLSWLRDPAHNDALEGAPAAAEVAVVVVLLLRSMWCPESRAVRELAADVRLRRRGGSVVEAARKPRDRAPEGELVAPPTAPPPTPATTADTADTAAAAAASVSDCRLLPLYGVPVGVRRLRARRLYGRALPGLAEYRDDRAGPVSLCIAVGVPPLQIHTNKRLHVHTAASTNKPVAVYEQV